VPDTVPTAATVARHGFVRRWAGRLGLLLFGLVLALLLGEVLIRMFANEGPIQTFRDREIGRRFTRSWEGDVYVEEAGRVVHQRFNAEGMRDRDWPLEPLGGEVRAAVLGDSMVAALATDESRRFTSTLRFRSTPVGGPPADGAMNWGVSGSSPALAVRLFETRVKRYAPDLVVLVWFVGNDLSDDWPALGGRRLRAAELRGDGTIAWPPFAEETSPLSEWLARSSRLYVWQKRLMARVRHEDDRDPRPGVRALEVGSDPVLADAWRMADAVLARFNTSVRAAGARPGLLVLPCAEQVYDDLWNDTERAAQLRGTAVDRWAPQQRLKEVALRLDVAFRAVRPSASLLLSRPDHHLFLGGTGHLNERGHDLVRGELDALLLGMLEAAR
jgi:hypothetical protein